ncbi:hypothetical protein GCM10023081_13750 [Arthrobacter ginkgonis]|uniref:NADPH-dependent FMN reductase-like domain-containing protein n=1 Tax=Arthrobacter ginkgonis TaxID=1630594 RepID=A0ABP7C3S2_9MICC
MTLNIGIILGSTRPGRKGADVAAWVHARAAERTDARYELIDLADFGLPHLDEPGGGAPYRHQHTRDWSAKISEFDGYVFVTPEYNHSVPSALKGAIDFLNVEWHNKAAGLVSYGGSAGGSRAAEHLRQILATLQVATVATQVSLPFATEFERGTDFRPGAYQLPYLAEMFSQVVAWSGALRALRVPDEELAASLTAG